MKSIYNFTTDMLNDYFQNINETKYRSRQIFENIYKHKMTSFDMMSNINKNLKEKLKEDFNFDTIKLKLKQESKNSDTIKFLYELNDSYLIESVLMKHPYGYSLCVTTQVGCNMGCEFCASGLKKKKRDLQTYEIVSQVLESERLSNKKITHIVIMGIGEPFDNYTNVINFIKIINSTYGLEIGIRHITLSTSGIVPKIYEFASFNYQVNLAISLHSANNDIRDKLMPINKKYNLDVLKDAIKDYIKKTNRRVTIEYILLDGINDSDKDALLLINFLKGLLVYVNLIPYNEVLENPYKRSKRIKEFYDVLKKHNVNVTLRKEFGHDIDAACGQLRSKYE